MLQTDVMPVAERLLHQNLDEICKPYLPQEGRLLREIQALDSVRVMILPNVHALGTEPGRSHANCHTYALYDTEHQARVVTGWMETGLVFACRSVIRRHEHWLCLTPPPEPGLRHYEFRPDPGLQHRPVFEGQAGHSIFRVFRHGAKLAYPAVRKWPREIRSLGLAARRRLQEGEPPVLAMRRLREDFAALMQAKAVTLTLQ